MSNYTPEEIELLLEEIEKWLEEGLLTEDKAQILRKRYQALLAHPSTTPSSADQSVSESETPSFEMEPPVPEPASAPVASPVLSTPFETPTSSRTSLAAIFLSESSIKIALYLGAFFVIAAALILAALVETLRLPILLGASLTFGAGALLLKKRLQQPSFILWLVFSSLLLISSGVQSDLLGLAGRQKTTYWMVVFLIMSAVWGLSTWLYVSRFFSLAAFGALATATWHFSIPSIEGGEFFVFSMTVTGLLGLIGAWWLKKWQSRDFALPLYLLVQGFEFVLVIISGLLIVYNLFMGLFTDTGTSWLLFALTWLLFSIFYVISDLVIPFPPFRFFAAVTLMPVAWMVLNEVQPSNAAFAFGWWIWGLALFLAGEIASAFGKNRVAAYDLPLHLASLPLLFIGSLIGRNEGEWLGFLLFFTSALVLTMAHVRKTRFWIWTFAIVCWIVTWFLFFTLPSVRALNLHIIFITSGLLLPLALLDWGLAGEFSSQPSWRWPLRFFTLSILVAATLISLFASRADSLRATMAFVFYALIGLGYALRFRMPALLAIFTGYLPIGLLYVLRYFDLNGWLPALTVLFTLYYSVGYLLIRFGKESSWADVLRWSGLIPGLLISLAAGLYKGPGDGLYVGVIGILFVIEMFERFAWLEIVVHGLYVLAMTFVLQENQVKALDLYLMSSSVILLGLDMFFERTLRHRTENKNLPRLAGWLAALWGNIFLLTEWQTASGLELAISLTYTLLFLAYALVYRNSSLSFLFNASLAITTLTVAGTAGLKQWTGLLTLFSLACYFLGFFDWPKDWGQIRRVSGLLIATATALSAPTENSGLWVSVPVAIAATLWAIEAFYRRNVWLGFPANGLYLMAYYIILIELQVTQPQFFSVGAALLGLIMHYFLTRSGANTAAFLTGMVSQLVLLGTTYIQMISTNALNYFTALFFQSIAVMFYGLVFRSRSLVFTPILVVVLGVITVIFSVLRGLTTVIMIGCTGILFILLGILAVWQRERLSDLRDRLSKWNP
ncbi:MAG: hypothetical protein WHS87_10095 [Anaerolineales bacterium]